jgi:hypothetical protein
MIPMELRATFEQAFTNHTMQLQERTATQSHDYQLSITKHNIRSLYKWAVKRLREDRVTLSEKDRLQSEIYWDGYTRALDHIMEMNDQ